ncbi:glycosyltransferase family protein [Nonomuraea recticatena]|uniref:hypothetical protein n=1 Tax=Nonomuraea recticatena TaxID=46178 RepID=UPI00360AC4F7
MKTAWAVAVCAVALTLLPRFALDQLTHPGFYRADPERTRAAAAAVSKIPSGAVVEVTNSLGPALTSRATVLLLDGTPRQAPWVVADVARWEYPFGSPAAQAERVALLLGSGYVQVFERNGYVVLRRTDPASPDPL